MLYNPEDFESGSSPFSLDSVGNVWGGAAVALDTTSKVNGVKSLKLNATAAGSAIAQKVLAADSDEIYLQFKVFFPTSFSFGTASAGAILALRDNADSDILSMSIADYGNLQLVFNNFGGVGYVDSLPALTKNVVHTIELHFKRAASGGRIRVWVDNNHYATPNYDSGAANTGSASFRKLTWGLPYTDGTFGTFYEDLLTADTKYIGIRSTAVPDLTWKGYDWFKRDADGSESTEDPSYNGKYSPANISAPDGNGYITLSVTNPSGNSPIAAEMFTVDPGGGQFGYGTYKLVVGTRMDTLPPGVVFGGLFTYEDQATTGDAAISHNEIDIDETSDWGEGAGVHTSHNYFYNNFGVKGSSDIPFSATSDPVVTHVMTWEPGRITFDSYVGTGIGGVRLSHRDVTTNVPVPTGDEYVDLNLWVVWGSTNNAPTTTPTSVVVRDFTFTAYVPPAPPTPVVGESSFFFDA